MSTIQIFQVDAFAAKLFEGNPAAVCPLDAWLEPSLMQAIARENNLSETAFFVAQPHGHYHLRWFTPAVEVELCGHATLASAAVLMERLRPDLREVTFDTLSGPLTVRRQGDLYALDLPARPPQPCLPQAGLLEALGAAPLEVWGAKKYMLVYARRADVEALRPDMRGLRGLDRDGVIVTAPGDEGLDFVSRYFCPDGGVDEDPVTGSAHCTLVPYWAQRLGKTTLRARQVSARGGELGCELIGERVRLLGRCAFYMEGRLGL